MSPTRPRHPGERTRTGRFEDPNLRFAIAGGSLRVGRSRRRSRLGVHPEFDFAGGAIGMLEIGISVDARTDIERDFVAFGCARDQL